MRKHTRRLLLPAVLSLALWTTACGGGGNGNDQVATLSNDDGSTEQTGNDSGTGEELTEEERQQAMLDFAACMREHGVDMPDPTFDENGRGLMIGGVGGDAMDPAVMEAAQEACQPLMQEVIDSAPELDEEEAEKMKEQALEFARCMREHGVDFPDPQFEGGGRMTQSMTADPNDPAFQDAQEACAGDGDGPGFSINVGPAGGSSDGDQ
jgi:hypothetical protein